jgi:protein SCO1
MVAAVLTAMAAVVALPRRADSGKFTREEVTVEVPDVTLVNQRGDRVPLQAKLGSERPVFVEFIFATCTTICPVLSAGYASLQGRVEDPLQVELVSITIDPEHDGPPQLREYLDRYGAKPGWDFLTGTREDIDTVMRAFDAFVADKMSHRPLIFVHAPHADHWVRLYGFPGSKDLLAEYEDARAGSDRGEE